MVHCSPPRFTQAFDAFIKSLGITHPIRIIVPGGLSSLGAGLEFVLSKQFKVLRDQIELLVEEHPHMTPRFVLINTRIAADTRSSNQNTDSSCGA